MRRKRIVFGILTALVSTLIPIILILLMAWQIFIQNEQKRIDTLTEQLIRYIGLSIDQTTHALKTLSSLQINPCSPEHIIRMRQTVFQTDPIKKIAYLENETIRCSSWSATDRYNRKQQIDFVTPDDVAVDIQIVPSFSSSDFAMLLMYGSYGAFINTERFFDTIEEEDIQMIFAAANGAVVTEKAQTLSDFLHQLILAPNNVQNPEYLYSIAQRGVWVAATAKPKSSISQYLQNECKFVFPVASIIGLFIFVLVLSLFLKRPSPKSDLLWALKKKEFQVHYQPIIDLQTGRCSGAEALLRWQRPDGSIIRPDIFIPLAEETGLIKPITDQLIEMVACDMREALVTNRELHITINLCADDIKTGRVLPIITDKFGNAGIKPEQIWLEVTEHGILDVGSARLSLNEARKQGHVIAIDDFGTGYSSLQYLQTLPIDVLKIDKSFVDSIGTGSASSTVVSHIIAMAKSLELTLVAEGVETQNQADYLVAHGVEFAQGWLYYKALPAQAFLDAVTAKGN